MKRFAIFHSTSPASPVFVIAVDRGPEVDGRIVADKVVARCEGGSCLISARETVANG